MNILVYVPLYGCLSCTCRDRIAGSCFQPHLDKANSCTSCISSVVGRNVNLSSWLKMCCPKETRSIVKIPLNEGVSLSSECPNGLISITNPMVD